MSAAYELAMFPLESPIIPAQPVPLTIFEPRYRRLARDLQAFERPEFGVVGISRGREVGGADVRTDVGVVAHVSRSEEFADGRWAMLATGTRRVRVDTWLPDDPYPRALVSDWPDPFEPHLQAALADVRAAVERLAEAVRRRRPDVVFSLADRADDPGFAIWQLIGFAGLGALDLQHLLSVETATERARRAVVLIDDRRGLIDALGDQ